MSIRRLSTLGMALILVIFLVSCLGKASPGGSNDISTAQPQKNTPILLGNTVSASGEVIPKKWVNLSFLAAGQDLKILVSVGDKVDAGQLLAIMDNTAAQDQLTQAQFNLSEMTSPQAIANAEVAVNNAKLDLNDAQQAYNSTLYWTKDDALIKDYYDKYLSAKVALATVQGYYNYVKSESPTNNMGAVVYQAFYDAQQAYDDAKFNYDVYSIKPAQVLVDNLKARLHLAQAELTNAQNYLAALTGGDVPKDASGSNLEQLREAQLAVNNAQKALDNTELYSPFSGSIVQINGHSGEIFTPVKPLIVLADFSTLQVQTKDMGEVDTGRVHIGDAAKVSFDALPNIIVTGKVIQIALRSSSGSGVYYTITIGLDTIPADLRWGMSAFTTISVKK
jgi:HlyD family secretion protein